MSTGSASGLPGSLANRERGEQELRNGLEVMSWIEHLTGQPDGRVPYE